jgi:DNA (cytosine-5)-methyltransferase 1
MALGFEKAGFDVLAAVELDPVHLAAHERNFPLCEPVCDDVARVTVESIETAAARGWSRRYPDEPFGGSIDCVFGGPSCQGFSVIGPRDPRDRRNDLVHEFIRIVIEVRPRWFVLENVPGLISPAYADVLEKVNTSLRAGGYRVADPWVLNARDHGVPQDRKRVFIVGARCDQLSPVKPSVLSERITVADALDDLPALTRFRRLLVEDRLNLTTVQLERMHGRQGSYVKRINGTIADVSDRSDRRDWDEGVLTSVGLTAHRDDVIARFRRLKRGVRDDVGRLPKLDERGQSPTLRAGTGRDHGSFTSARPVHYRSPRVITVREAARLHGFPDWFGFHSTRWHGFRQVGNAVPPPLAHAVARAITTASGSDPARRASRVALGRDALLEMTLVEAARYYGLPMSMLPKNVRAGKSPQSERKAA